MKWLSNRYAYPLVVLVISASVVLQLAWLNQLFDAQKAQIKVDLEQAVADAAKMSTYLSVSSGHKSESNFRQFFLSSEWLQFNQAYHKLRLNHADGIFTSNFDGDSTFVNISLRFGNRNPVNPRRSVRMTFDEGKTLASELAMNRIAVKRMDSLVHLNLRHADISVAPDTILYYEQKDLLSLQPKREKMIKAAFVSQPYAYNFINFGTYQLVVQDLKLAVIYRMRYYILSSGLMLLLTGAAFIFILRLMHSQRMYADARISFTSNMTHELKTPVATVAIALESILENHLENEPLVLKNYLEIGRSELRRLNLMIDKVLNLEQLDNGQVHLRTELYDVQFGVQQVIDSMKLQIDAVAAKVNWQPTMKPCFVYGDPVHLTNVFYNLIENALKHGGKGVELTISSICNETEVCISFKDNGPGIAPIYQQRIFERYFRVPSNTPDTHNAMGFGLGLSYVNNILQKQGGSIRLVSLQGEGSTFIIHFKKAS
jgi:signal transduction histidine kinase